MVIVMNVIRASRDRAEEVQEAFVRRERHLDGVPGFVGFDLLRRDADELEADEPQEFVVQTRWASQQAFDDWVASDHFFRSHAHRDPTLTQSLELRSYAVLEVDPPTPDEAATAEASR